MYADFFQNILCHTMSIIYMLNICRFDNEHSVAMPDPRDTYEMENPPGGGEQQTSTNTQFSSCSSVCHTCVISGGPWVEDEDESYPAEKVTYQWQEILQEKKMRVFQEAFLAQPILDPNMNVTWDQDPDQGQVRKTK